MISDWLMKQALIVLLGCGQHISQALAGLKEDEICKCKEEKKDQENK